MNRHALSRRRSGILLHPTSLPSGKLDGDVVRWLDFLVAAGQSVWQVLPLGIPCTGYSPYQCLSAYALNPALLPEPGQELPDTGGEHFDEWKRRQAHWLEDFAAYSLIRRLQKGRPWYEWPEPWRDRHEAVLARLHDEYADELDLIRHEQFRVSRAWRAVHEALSLIHI